MNEETTLQGFAALSHGDRLRIVRMLVVAGAEGMSAGAIAEALDHAQPSRVSFHLKELERAQLLVSRRDGKSIIYSADFPALSNLVAFLMHDCCQGHCVYCDKAIKLFAKCTGRPTENIDD
ncbi:TPA: ArsR/SmtB family transcription factor [Pseudomonas aeruginosa]